AFAAELEDGREGIFQYDSVANQAGVVLLTGAPTSAGRELCTFEEVERNDAGELVVVGGTRPDCAIESGPALRTLLLVTADGIEPVVAEGAPAPLPGSVVRRVVGRPRIDAAGNLSFRLTLTGASRGEALFVRRRATGAVELLVREGDALPGGGRISNLVDAQPLADGA